MDQDQPFQPVYFIGVRLPKDLERQVSGVQWQLAESNKAMLRPVMPHITLLHPPSLEGILPSQLLPKIRQATKRYLPLTIALEEVGFFGERVGFIRAQSLRLESLQQQLVNLLPPETQALHYKRPYVPHITLAQIYKPKTLDRSSLVNAVESRIKLPQQITISSVSRFQHVLPREYRAEEA